MALDKKLTENQLILADAELTQKVIDLKAAGAPYEEQAAAKAEHRAFKQEWRELRQWVLAVNASTVPDGDAIAQAQPASVSAKATSAGG